MRKYLAPLTVGTLKGPQMSVGMISKSFELLVLLLGKDRRVCFAKGQLLHNLDLEKYMVNWECSVSSGLTVCPRCLCHKETKSLFCCVEKQAPSLELRKG